MYALELPRSRSSRWPFIVPRPMEVALALLILIVVPNAWATWRVARSRLMPLPKKMLIVTAWLIPILGANIALREVAAEARRAIGSRDVDVPRARPPRRHAPATVDGNGQEPFDFRDHVQEGSVPIVDFAALDAWAGKASSAEGARSAREKGRRAWLLFLRNSLGERAELVEAHGCRVLSGYSQGTASAVCRFMADSHKRIAQLLEGMARFPEEPPTLISFDGDDVYRKYVSSYYPEQGEYFASGTIFINAGYPHLVAVRGNLSELEPAIAHEMTHCALAHLSLPLWLDEGLAVHTGQRIFASERRAGAASELLAKHHEFWNPDTIQEFWCGGSFHRTFEGERLSNDLARLMVELIGRDWGTLVRFATQARRPDGGMEAARAGLGLDLGDLAASAIDVKPDASWAPRPDSWKSVSIKAASALDGCR